MTAQGSHSLLKELGDFSLNDLETIWLILRGSSVIDWHRLNFDGNADARAFLNAQVFEPDDPGDRERLEQIRDVAIDYLRRNFDFPIPRPVETSNVEQLLHLASSKGHRQLCACTILKAMHIIHHVEARELAFSLALSDQDLFRLIEERVYRLVGNMLSEGFPITEFVGGRKRRDSIYTKLLSKAEAHASAVYDKLRFRIVTRSRDDIMPVLLHLTHHLFPFNYVVPSESINSIYQFRSYCNAHPHLDQLAARLQQGVGDDLVLSDNVFSAEDYRIIHFVVDLPVRVPHDIMAKAPPHAQALGAIVFGLCEFQMVDQETEETNETGDASHARYKNRQRRAVRDRLKLGATGARVSQRGLSAPGRRAPPESLQSAPSLPADSAPASSESASLEAHGDTEEHQR